MMNPICIHHIKVFAIVSLVALAGCARTTPSNFYSLSAMSEASYEMESGTIGNEIALGIGPLKLPDYLNRPQIITRKSQNEFTVAEYDRWAGQLNDSLLQVIAENISALLSTERIATYPWRSTMPMDYQVEIEILQFDGNPQENAVLIARWTVTEMKSKKIVAMKRSSITESVAEAGYAGLVAAQSRAVSKLSGEISSVIIRIYQQKELVLKS